VKVERLENQIILNSLGAENNKGPICLREINISFNNNYDI
jgi:hypothetical protein